MANRTLFQNAPLNVMVDTVNEAGGRAYRLSPKHQLAQLAATGCFNGTYYASADVQLSQLLSLAEQTNDPVFLAKLAIYARERAFMKDMPAALLLMISKHDPALFHQVFDRVIDNGKMLRTLLQMVRSGQFGRKSLSYSLQRAFQRWLNRATPNELLTASIGNQPSLRDVLRLARPTPADNMRRAMFGWLTDTPIEKWAPAGSSDLPAEIIALIAFRAATTEAEQIALLEQDRFRWDLLADSIRGPAVWRAVARQMGSQALRMNLNTLLRHEVFADESMIAFVAERLRDAESIRRSRQFPYQFLAAYLNAEENVPAAIRAALHEAAEIACGNIPELPGPIIIGLDVSGSMGSAITGRRGSGTSKVRCVDVASLFAAAILRRNPGSVVIPFDTIAHAIIEDADTSILTLAERMSEYGGGGTNCGIPLQHANTALAERQFAGCVLVSDNESWVGEGRHQTTAVMEQWQRFTARQTTLAAKAVQPQLVCIDLQPHGTTQAPERPEILNIGGFSDAVFEVVSAFLGGDDRRFVVDVEAIEV